MARLVPDAPDPATASTAERRLLERLAKLPAEWAVLHSVGLSIHDRKPWAEIDFVVIGPAGVFCLEVKGGPLARRGGLWVFNVRGDFDLRPSLRARIARVNSELLKLTVEEFRVLDGLAENDRAIVSGGAGTGKTLLAVEEAIRLEKQGARVLLCCYNRQLARFLERVVEEKSGITAATLHAFMREIIQRDGRHPE